MDCTDAVKSVTSAFMLQPVNSYFTGFLIQIKYLISMPSDQADLYNTLKFQKSVK